MSNKIFTQVHFLPIQRKSFHTIKILITDDTSTKVPFEYG